MTMSRQRILFVDDEVNVLEALRRALRGKRDGCWEMVFVQSAREALEKHHGHPFHVIVTDLRMPGMSGLDLVREVRQFTPETVPIVLTGAADLQTAVTAINEISVFRFYTKPCPAERLIEGIEAALARHAAISAAPAGKAADFLNRENGVIGAAALDRLPVGVLVVDAEARVVFMNRHGAEIVGRKDGLWMDGTGICRANSTTESSQLRKLIEESAQDAGELHHEAALRLSRPSLLRPLSVVVSRLEEDHLSDLKDKVRVMILVADPESPSTLSAPTIARLFGLTNAEAVLSKALAEGQRLEEAAVAAGITVSSARTYLKRIFDKTGTSGCDSK